MLNGVRRLLKIPSAKSLYQSVQRNLSIGFGNTSFDTFFTPDKQYVIRYYKRFYF